MKASCIGLYAPPKTSKRDGIEPLDFETWRERYVNATLPTPAFISNYNPSPITAPVKQAADKPPLPPTVETASGPPVFTLPLNDESDYPIFEAQIQEWAGLYPAVDVIQQLRNMKGWLDGNPSGKKTRRGIVRFITGWLAREQDKGGQCAPKDSRRKSWEELAREMEARGEL